MYIYIYIHIYIYIDIYIQGVSKKIEQILNRSQFCKKAFGINFFTHADHSDICDVEQ